MNDSLTDNNTTADASDLHDLVDPPVREALRRSSIHVETLTHDLKEKAQEAEALKGALNFEIVKYKQVVEREETLKAEKAAIGARLEAMSAGGGRAEEVAQLTSPKHADSDHQTTAINKILSQYGFSPLDSTSNLTDKLSEILQESKQRGLAIQNLRDNVNKSHNESFTAEKTSVGLNAMIERLEREKEILKAEKEKSDNTLSAFKKKAATEIRKLKSDKENLTIKLQQSSNRVKAKESVIDKLTSKLDSTSQKEKQNLEYSKTVFSSLQNRGPRLGSQSDTKALEVIGMYEANKGKMDDEMHALRSEVRELNEALRVKENNMITREIGGVMDNAGESVNRLKGRVEEVEGRNRELEGRRSGLERKLTKMENKQVDVKERLRVTRDENTNLLLELQSRPTVKQYKSAERRIDELERKLYAAVEAAQESNDVKELKRHMNTKTLIEQDKANHRLRLERLDAIPREISKEILKQTCRELDISDATLIAPCIRKMSKAMLLLPRLENFINDVCGFVFKHSTDKENKKGSKVNRRTMEDVMPVLKNWEKQLNEHGKSSEFKAIIMSELCRRSVVPKKTGLFNRAGNDTDYPGLTADMSEEQALRAIRDLVELEKSVMAREDLYRNAEEVVSKNPDLFVNRVVLHFRYLFGVKHMEGVFPKMNEVYLFVNEMNAFIRELRSMFGIKSSMPTASVVKMMLEVASELEKTNQLAAMGAGGEVGEEEEELENYVVM
ncbi:hypothetical protein TL16_g11150 [Triparma laevis f. inornata]|uniref:Centrosomal protein of 70 kDa n=1 Tax=Triparma laevis f. inornata TaxID=1714386 RepID=A0A9W7BKQ8_9STRA|nr:hypothetical protein TL16_g11150 [Triparma laevis f. inornata]